MHIVFIVGSYYPNYSAVSNCVGNVADVLSKTHQVTVICEKSYSEQTDEEIFNSQKIVRVITNEKKIRDILNDKIQGTQGITRKIHTFILNLYKSSRVAKTILSPVSIKQELVERYIEALTSIEDKIDVIIPASMPFESVVVAAKYKNDYDNEVKVIPYLFDQFADSNTLHRFNLNKKLKRRKHIKLEKETLIGANYILSMHSLKNHFLTDLPEVENIQYIEHPLIKNRDFSKPNNMEEIKISYIGGLYKNYVVPDYLLKLFKMVVMKEVVLHFYIIGNCSKIVNRYCSYLPKKIVNHGSVDKQTASIQITNSNILISIAEKKGIQMSSKIFEYMSCGKPIIHFYNLDNDVNLKMLKKYPLALCLKQDNTLLHENLLKFEKFCNENHNVQIPFEEVEKLFVDAIPKYTADLIISVINKEKD